MDEEDDKGKGKGVLFLSLSHFLMFKEDYPSCLLILKCPLLYI